MGASKQEAAAADAARTQSQLAGDLWGASKGPLSEILQMLQGNISGGPNAIPDQVGRQFDAARSEANLGYDSSIRANRELAGARARTSGQPYSTGELDSAIAQGTFALNQSREAALRNLQFQEAQAGMGQYNQMLSLLGQGANTAFGLGQGFSGSQMGAISQMGGGSTWGNVLGGAASGAAAGSTVAPGYGTAIGAVLGGIGGYMSGGG